MNVEIKVLFVFRSDKFIGMLSIGDIQRAIIKQVPLDFHIGGILRKGGFTYASVNDSFEDIKAMMIKKYQMFFYPQDLNYFLVMLW